MKKTVRRKTTPITVFGWFMEKRTGLNSNFFINTFGGNFPKKVPPKPPSKTFSYSPNAAAWQEIAKSFWKRSG
ncbi:MAG TPA: hypothetical protein VJM57_08005, partial [Thermodesulfobacteriota bacterium]|nr:hypothetical protein [Thermodesulfobacteriota bacterium]